MSTPTLRQVSPCHPIDSTSADSGECPSPGYCQAEGSCGAAVSCYSSEPCLLGAAAAKRKYLCHCLRVTEDQVREAVADRGLVTVRQVTASCGAGGGCTACHRHIKRVIAEEATSLEPAYASSAEGTLFGHNLSASVATLG